MNRLFMGTTSVSPEKTLAQIIGCLVRTGARQISQEYNGEGRLVGIRFALEVLPHNIQCFSLPAKTDPVFKALWKHVKRPRKNTESEMKAKAERIAWRQLYRWTEAQLAMVEIGMVEAAEVFLPYMESRDGRTLFSVLKDQGMKMLPTGKAEKA